MSCVTAPLSCEKFEIMMSGGADVSALAVRKSHSLKNRMYAVRCTRLMLAPLS